MDVVYISGRARAAGFTGRRGPRRPAWLRGAIRARPAQTDMGERNEAQEEPGEGIAGVALCVDGGICNFDPRDT